MDGLLTIGVSNAAAVAVLSILLIPVARWLRRPALTHAICVLLLLKLVTPPLFTLSLHWLPSAAARPTENSAPPAVPAVITSSPDDDLLETNDSAADEP